MAARYQLVLKSGANAGLTYPLEGDVITIGRDASNMLVVNDPEVSRKHARIYWQGGQYFIEDLGSTNGTSVNGIRLEAAFALRGGELITLGENTHLLFESVALDPDATVAAIRTTPEVAKPAGEAVDKPIIPPPASATYVGQVPESTPLVGSVQPDKKKMSPLVIGLIVVVVFLAVGCIAAFIFDYLNLYCVRPFNTITNFFIPGGCPP